jgi:hypothetical protein
MTTPDLKSLHDEYCSRTGMDIAFNMTRERVWQEWMAFNKEKPFTLDDLKTVIAYLRSKIRTGNRNDGALKFSNLIGSPDFFEEDLALARQWREEKRQPFGGIGLSVRPKKEEPVERATFEDLQALRRESEQS